uniref:uncharacterized protein LOC122604409 n=1 Tax=Erigeron canadensis TaxID=72917 RepID=UPI001CB948AD|nr:uncharacterized protein LOC122604409 [Erigeron canadensis]
MDAHQKVESVEKWPIHNRDTPWRLKKPQVGENYVDHHALKECMTYYGLVNGFSIRYEKSTKKKLIARCGKRPPRLEEPTIGKQRKMIMYPATQKGEEAKRPWRCYGKRLNDEASFQVVSMVDEHNCTRNFRFGSLVSYKWIGNQFGNKIRANPNIMLVEIADLVMKKYKCIVTHKQCRSSKNYALNEFEKSIEEHYGMLRSYGDELFSSNPGSTITLNCTRNPDDKLYFQRMYICLKGLKDGWKKGCRKVIALDGCFLKSPNTGEYLTAIGRDGNNHIYPIAWAVVNGLIEAVKDMLPYEEHRHCARHIYENFRKRFSGLHFRSMFWAASKACYPVLFEKAMRDISLTDPLAYQYLMDRNPKSWSRAFFKLHRGCDSVENGFSECFNYVILTVTNKPIITMFEAIRAIIMERQSVIRKDV